MAQKKLLFAGDHTKSTEQLKRFLVKFNWIFMETTSREEALNILKNSSFDIFLVDLNLSELNGMELINSVQVEVNPKPKVIIITEYEFPEIRKRATELNVFGYFTKPLHPKKFTECLYRAAFETNLPLQKKEAQFKQVKKNKPPFVGIFIAVSTGGPQTLKQLFTHWDFSNQSSVFIVQHGPDWALDTIPNRLIRSFNCSAHIAQEGVQPETGKIYIAPGDQHLCIGLNNYQLNLVDSPPENFFRPAADPLFRSGAYAFGRYGIGVVLSGLGCDASLGAKMIAENGGTVLIQDPQTAVAPHMPRFAIESGIDHKVVPLMEMGNAISKCVDNLVSNDLEIDI